MATATTTKKPAPKAPARSRAKTTAHPLADLIPAKRYIDNYAMRLFNRDSKGVGWSDLSVLLYALKAHLNVLMSGDTGAGKTMCIFAFGAEQQKPVVTVACNGGADPSTFWGQFRKLRDGSIEFVESSVLKVIRYGGILYLDEINFLHPRIAAVLHGLLDGRRTVVIPELGNEAITAHPDLLVVAAYNPDYQGTRPLNEAFKNRFTIQLDFEYERYIEEQVVSPVEGVDIGALLDVANHLRSSYKEGVLSTPTSTNMLMDFLTLGSTFDYDFAVMNFVNHFHADERPAVKNYFEMEAGNLQSILDDLAEAEDE